MKKQYYQRLTPSKLSYEERIGPPDTISASIGSISLNFSELEREVSSVISHLLGCGPEVGRVVSAELSFRGKLDLVSSLYRHTKPIAETLRQFDDLLVICAEAESSRNQVLHSSWFDAGHSLVKRVKLTARRKQGFRQQTEQMTSADLMDIADFIAYAMSMVDEFFSAQFDAYRSWTWEEIGY